MIQNPGASEARRELSIEFNASGRKYFRIWIVNLLLTVLTLGFYLPFAKARRLRYFYANTVVDGHPLAFHGNPWKMFKGYLLMLALLGAYAMIAQFSPWKAFWVLLLLAALWPALWRSSLRFRLCNTSWRGLRFGFAGGLDDVYAAMAPVLLPALFFLGAQAWHFDGVNLDNEAEVARAAVAAAPWLVLPLLLLIALLPYSLARMKTYQQGGLRFAGQVAELAAGPANFYALALRTFVAQLLAAVGAVVIFAIGGVGWALMAGMLGDLSELGAFAILLLLVGWQAWIGAHFAAELQNLVWNATRSQALQVRSQLNALDLTALTVRNLLLTVFSLGMYRPFAVVNSATLRLGSVGLTLQGEVAEWRADAGSVTHSAADEMSGDFFGIDMGL